MMVMVGNDNSSSRAAGTTGGAAVCVSCFRSGSNIYRCINKRGSGFRKKFIIVET